MLLFVYGFLRRGQSEHEKLLDKGDPAHYLGPISTAPKYELRHNAVKDETLLCPGHAAIPGELYDIDQDKLSELNVYENREYVAHIVELSDGRHALAYMARNSVTE